jgi:hypothetical protein
MNKCIKIENIYIFMINSYCKYIACVSILNVDMAETMDTEADTDGDGAITITIDHTTHKVIPERMTQAEITDAIKSIHECNALLLTDKDALNESDLKKASDIINSLLGEQFHSVANSLLQMKMNREEELAEKEAKRNNNFTASMLGITPMDPTLWW